MKPHIITIDLNKETTPAKYAKRIHQSTAVVLNWIKRDQIKYRKIEELDLILVEIDSEGEAIKNRRRRIIESFLETTTHSESKAKKSTGDDNGEAIKNARSIIKQSNSGDTNFSKEEIEAAAAILREHLKSKNSQ